MAILWDLDNVSPGVDPERARITARRLRDAASRLGGGALGGASAASGEDVAGPADIVAFLGFANDATLARVSARALREEGVDVRRAESTPDAADMDLGAHVLGFARAWAASERGGADVSEPPPFVTPRALAAARAAARADAASALGAAGITHRSNDRAHAYSTFDGSSALESSSAITESVAAATLARFASETERAAFEHFTATAFARYDAQSNAVPPKAALFVVTSDNDVVPAVSFARRKCGVRVVACGDFLPKARLEGGGAQASKRRRAASRRFGKLDKTGTRLKRRNEVGVTPQYWSLLQAAADARPVGRLKLAAASDAALVWDSTRAFAVDGNESAAGGVVGVWRSGGERRGVGRWPSPRPAIPREDHS